jgi:hypothetical protein
VVEVVLMGHAVGSKGLLLERDDVLIIAELSALPGAEGTLRMR